LSYFILLTWLTCIYNFLPSTKLCNFRFLSCLSSTTSCNRSIRCKTITIIWTFFYNSISNWLWLKSICSLWFSLVHSFLLWYLCIKLHQELLVILTFITLESSLNISRVSKWRKSRKSANFRTCWRSASSISRIWFPISFSFRHSASSAFICSRKSSLCLWKLSIAILTTDKNRVLTRIIWQISMAHC